MQASTEYIKFILVLFPIHVFSWYIGNFLPLTLVYGPLIYAIKFEISFSKFYLHLMFPLLFTAVFFLDYYGFFRWKDYFSFSYNCFYYLLSTISMLLYFVFLHLKKQEFQGETSLLKKEFVYLLQMIYTIGCFFTVLLFLESIHVIIKLGFSVVFVINVLIGISFLFGFYYLLEIKKTPIDIAENQSSITINVGLMMQYEKDLKVYFEESKSFLKPDISLNLLSENTGIPKHHLTKLFNVQMGKKFYEVISEYRIEYAQERLKEDSNLTIESLAYECGFSSKSTFNKYFKKYTNYSPSQYRTSVLNIS